MPSSAQVLLLGVFLQSVTGMDLARAAQRNHARDVPIATSVPTPLAFINELNLLAGYNRLQVRQEALTTSNVVVTIAPDITCGYLSGMPGIPITCQNRSPCSWATLRTSGITLGLVACNSEIYVSCIESSKAVDPEACDDLCQSDIFNLFCTNSDEPFCRTYAYPKGIRDYRCASTKVKSVQSVKFTYDGEENPDFRTTTIGGKSSETLPTITDAGTTRSREPTKTDTQTTTTSDAPVPTEKSKSTPVGAIVGGVVGGIALIGLVGLSVFFLLRRRDSTPATNPTPAQPAMAQQQPPPAPPINQNQYPQQQPHPVVISSYPHPSMAASPIQPDPHLSIMSAPVSSIGPGSPTAWNQHLSPPISHSPAPTYEMAGPEAREQEPVYEIGTNSGKP